MRLGSGKISAMRKRLLALVFSGIAVAAALTGCTAADRAVASADRCADAEASPKPPSRSPGQVVAVAPLLRSDLPVGPVAGWEDVVSVADAGSAAAAVHSDGTVSVVGSDHLGQLAGLPAGPGGITVPQRVPGVTDAVSVTAAGSAFLVVHRDGTVTAWGDHLIAAGGVRGTDRAKPIPEPVPGVEDIVFVAHGALNVLALRGDGRVTGWGINLVDSLGEPNGTEVRTLREPPGAVSLANADDAAIIATGAGEVCAWGNNVNGLLGVEPRGGQTTNPVRVGDLTGIVQVTGGSDTAYARDDAGSVWAWGRGAAGMLGDGETEQPPTTVPIRIDGIPPMRWIGAADFTGLGIDEEGSLWQWGSGIAGEPFVAEQTRLPQPVMLPGPAQEVSGRMVLLGGH